MPSFCYGNMRLFALIFITSSLYVFMCYLLCDLYSYTYSFVKALCSIHFPAETANFSTLFHFLVPICQTQKHSTYLFMVSDMDVMWLLL